MSLKNHPVVNFTKLLTYHRVIPNKKFLLVAAFYLKLLVREPFRIMEKIRFDKEVSRQVTIEKDPVFILGHWRSGTSYLQYLLGRDPQFGYMNKFQSIFPDLFLGSERLLKPLIKKIGELFPVIVAMDNISINADWDSPGELDVALTTLMSRVSLHWGHMFPQEGQPYFDKYLFFDNASEEEVRQWKRVHKYLMKKLTKKKDGKQLIIKSPGNTARIRKLLELYPGAKFIYIHRNPYDVFYSNRKLWGMILNNISLQELEREQVDEKILEIYERLVRRYLNQRSLIPEGNLAELKFEKFVDDPLKELEKVYGQLNLTGFDRVYPAFEEFVQQAKAKSPSEYDYDRGIIQMINDRWNFSLDRWPYPNPLNRTEERLVSA